jgi:hypothetical protein
MKDEKKHLYRIDPLRVKQKLYELYPKGSEAHKMMAREEKIKEYSHLARTLSSMPLEVVKQVAEQNKTLVLGMTLKMFGFGVMALGFGLASIYATTQLEFILLGVLLLFSLYGAFTRFLGALKIAYSIKSFEEAMKKTQERMAKLQKDIFS